MQNSMLELSALTVTYGVFGAIGYRLAGKLKTPVSTGTWAMTVLGIIVLGFGSFGETWLFAVDGFHIYLLYALQALLVGMFIGLLVRELRNKRLRNKSA